MQYTCLFIFKICFLRLLQLGKIQRNMFFSLLDVICGSVQTEIKSPVEKNESKNMEYIPVGYRYFTNVSRIIKIPSRCIME